MDLSDYCKRARGLLSKGRTEDALALYGDVLLMDPMNALAYADRGTAYAMSKQYDLALLDLEQAFALGHADASAYSTVGTVYLELKQYQTALDYFTKASALAPGYPYTYYNRSKVLYEMGNAAGAMADLERCLALGPDDSMKQLILRRMILFRTAL